MNYVQCHALIPVIRYRECFKNEEISSQRFS